MISKELLSEVLGYKVEIEESEHWLKSSNSVVFVDLSRKGDITDTDFINIYELAHKCKEWAFNNGYYLTIYNDAVDIILQTNCKLIENITDDSFKYSPMLVFKACQWILDNKNTKETI